MLVINNDNVNNLSITPLPAQNPNLARFDASSSVEITYSASAQFDGTQRYKFMMYLDATSGYNCGVFWFHGVNDDIMCYLIDSSLYLSGKYAPLYYTGFPIIDLDLCNKKLYCEILRTTGQTYVTSFTVNGSTLSGTSAYWSGGGAESRSSIGEIVGATYGGIPLGQWFDKGSIWDVRIYSSVGTLTHRFKGYPEGNATAGWADTVGSFNPTVAVNATRNDISYNNKVLSFKTIKINGS